MLIVRRSIDSMRTPQVRDQVLTSLVNLSMPTMAAVLLSAHEVGAVWIAFGTYQVALSVTRGFIALPGQLAIGRQSHSSSTPRVLSALVLPCSLGLLVAGAALVIRDNDVRRCLLVLAPTLPILLVLDCARHWAYAVHRADVAAGVSAIWAATHAAVAAVALSAHPTAATLIAAWALPGAVAGVISVLRIQSVSSVHVAITMSTRQRSFLAADALAGQLAAFAVPALAGVLATLSDVGVFQNSRLLFRPINLLLNLLLVAGIPLVNLAAEGRARLHRTRAIASKTVAVACLFTVVGLIGYLTADRLTDIDLSWPAIGYAAVESIAVGPYIVYSLLATMLMRAGTLLLVRVMAVATQVLAVFAFARVGAGGLAAASLLGMLVPAIVVPWWVTRVVNRENPGVVVSDRHTDIVA